MFSQNKAGKIKHYADLLRVFVISSVITILVIILLVGFGIHKIYRDNVMRDAEKSAIALSGLLSGQTKNMLFGGSSQNAGVSRDTIAGVDALIRNYLKPFHLIKIKVYSRDKRILYSTDSRITGQVDAQNEELEEAIEGKTHSEYKRKWKGDLENETQFNLAFIETYIPIRDAGNTVVGCFEIYTDVTVYQKEIFATLVSSLLLLGCVLLLSFIFLFMIMKHATNAIAYFAQEEKKYAAEIARLYAMTRSILDKSPFGVYVVNAKGCIEYVNPAMVHIAGETAEQFNSLRIFEQDTCQDALLSEKIKSVLAGETVVMKSFKSTSLHSKKTAVINISGMPFQEEGSMKALIFVEDITERENLEKMKTALTHMIIHDLNNPLAGIIGTIDAMQLEMGGIFSAAQEISFQMALQSGMEMKNMISDLLDINKMEEGKLNLRHEDIDLSVLLTEVREPMKILAQEGAKALSLDVPPGLAVWADRAIFKRIVSNLIGNALKFTLPGSTITVGARYDEDANECIVSVQDQGVGIPQEYITRVFEKFIQVEEAQMKGRAGKGLGLTFCKMAVEAHGGRIWVESVVDKGSTFYFTIPLKPQGVSPFSACLGVKST